MENNFTFREGTCDMNVFHDVVLGNQYRLPDSFEPGDVILDVGAHIGSFTWACLKRGARCVFAFEPEYENYSLLRKHLASNIEAEEVRTFPIAIDSPGFGVLRQSKYYSENGEVNTGGAFMSCHNTDQRPFEPGDLVLKSGFDQMTVSLGIERVRLLKLDCEYSEWPILRHSKLLTSCEQIIGEYHVMSNNGPEDIQGILNIHGFKVDIVPNDDHKTGLFFSSRCSIQ